MLLPGVRSPTRGVNEGVCGVKSNRSEYVLLKSKAHGHTQGTSRRRVQPCWLNLGDVNLGVNRPLRCE